jgi:hypothetical protein
VGGGHRAITAVGGTLGGYSFAGRNEEKRDERTAVREAAARRAAESDRKLDELNTGYAQAVELLGEHPSRRNRQAGHVIRRSNPLRPKAGCQWLTRA